MPDEQPCEDVAIPDEVRALVHNASPNPMAAIKGLRVAEANEPWMRLLGYDSLDEVRGRPISDFMAPGSVLLAKERIGGRAQGKTMPCNAVYEFVHKSGRIVRLELSAMLWPSDESIGLAIGRDVTERERSLQALEASEKLYRTLADAIPAAVMLADSSGRNIYVNDKCVALTGYSREEMMNGAWLGHPDDPDIVRLHDLAFAEGLPGRDRETQFMRKDGTTIWVSCSWEPIRDTEGNLQGVCSVFIDISDRKRAEETAAATEERFRLLAENAPDILWQMDLSGRFTYVSPAVRRYGYEPSEWVGHHLLEFLPAREQPIFRARFAENTHDPRPKRYEVEMLRKDGSPVWMEVSINFVLVEGSPIRVQGISRDISERKRAEQALQENEERYRSIVENSHDLIMLTAPDGSVSYLSPSCRQVIGYDPEDLVGTQPWIIHPDDLETAKEMHSRALKGESGADVEYRIITKQGKAKWVSHSWSPIYSAGDLSMVVSVVRDITERKQAEQTLRQAHDDLEKAYNLQREFLNNVTHEVRTPLTAVQGYVEMLLEGVAGPVTNEQAALLQRVLSSSRHLLDVVAGVLEVARLKSGTDTLRPTACKPAHIVERAVASVTPQAGRKNLAVHLHLVNGQRMGMYDEGKLAVILTNLLSNAVKFTEKGQIDVIVNSDATGVEVAILDTGIGIRQRDLPRIFDEFQQLDYPGKHKPAGFGLGLAIVANMVEIIGAELVVSSRKGVGTAFTLSVPSLEGQSGGG